MAYIQNNVCLNELRVRALCNIHCHESFGVLLDYRMLTHLTIVLAVWIDFVANLTDVNSVKEVHLNSGRRAHSFY